MKITILPALTAACALTFAGSAYAQRGHGPQPHAPKAPTTHVQGGAATHGGGGATTHGGGAAVHGGGASTHGGSHGAAASPKSTTHGPGANAKTTKTKTKGAAGTTSTTTSTTTASGTTTTASGTELTLLQQKLLKNTNLAAKLQTRLPDGVLVQDACLGFRNLGQFVAAVNVSNNLGLDFAQLKAKMTGMTITGETIAGARTMSLGQAIHDLKPTVDANGEALTAERQADALISASGR